MLSFVVLLPEQCAENSDWGGEGPQGEGAQGQGTLFFL